MLPVLRSTNRRPGTCLWKARFCLPAVVALFQLMPIDAQETASQGLNRPPQSLLASRAAPLPLYSSSLDLPSAPDPQEPVAKSPDLAHADTDLSWRKLPIRFLHDQKEIWLFPTQLAKGKHWVPTLAVTGITAGLLFADPHVMPYFRTHAGNLDDVNDVFDSSVTTGIIVAIPASLLVAGYARHDNYQVNTALLAGLAYADSAILDLAVKAVTRRERPSDVPPGHPFTDTFFAGGVSPFKGSSFPSGHAAGAFSVATVIATRYHHHRWVPWLAYGFATAVSLSRVSTLSHFPSDVFLGAALGYTITRYQTLGLE
jgi:membrane-associated phospholipid phosphatase